MYSTSARLVVAALLTAGTVFAAEPLGVFEEQTDIGRPSRPGSASADSSGKNYQVSGGGENMWATNDAFHFVWKRVSGDFSLAAAVNWITAGGDPHRKACLIARQSLSPNSPYIDVAVHGDGLTSLQFRESAGGLTREIQSSLKAPSRVALERQSNSFFMSVAKDSGALELSGAFMRVEFKDPIYVGIAVCAHNDSALEKAEFKNVQLEMLTYAPGEKPLLHSSLEIVPISSGDRRVVYSTQNHIEAPNWSPDGTFLLYNSRGRIYRLPLAAGSKPELVDTGFAIKCNNDHGISSDGKRLVISDQTETGKSLIYTLPLSGGSPTRVTPLGPSYWHGWSPDGKTLAYCAERNGEYDIYTIPAEGGQEVRLTSAKGLDDGPDYSPDGKFIYFNSDRTGSMQIWRMRTDGSEQTQMTSDEFNNWFPHPSPDGRWIVFLSYEKSVTGHPENKTVWLRLLSTAGGPIRELVGLFGGQGTINVPSWSPDSRQLAFVSYELRPARP